MGWFIYFGVVLAASLLLGWHLGRFRNACTEMTGMMAGMTIGMLGGFALGYGMAAAVGRDIFIGNLVGVILGAVLGGWFGRAGDLMGIMDGAMGGVMGGSMGAMIASMIYVDWKLQWTGVLFGGVYVVGALALTALIESRTPDHEHIHWLLPKLSRARRSQPVRVAARSQVANVGNRVGAPSAALPSAARSSRVTATTTSARQVTVSTAAPSAPAAQIRDYYALLKIEKSAELETIEEAYLNLLATVDEDTARIVDRAFTTLRDPQRRARYDAVLEGSRKSGSQANIEPAPKGVTALPAASSKRGDCCPPPKKKAQVAEPLHPAGAGTSQAEKPVAHAGAQVAAAASVASSATQTRGNNKAETLPPPPSPARQAGQLPSLKSAGAAVASSQGSNAHGNTGQGISSTSKHKGGKQGSPHSSHQSRQPVAEGRSKSRKAYGGSGDHTRRQSESYGRSARNYAGLGSGVGKSVAMGAAFGAAAILLVFWVAFGAAGGASGASRAQTAQGSYDNPAGAVYNAPGSVPSAEQLDGQAVAATVGADGVQIATLLLDENTSSYSPAAIKVKKGVPVRLSLTTNGAGRDCRSVVDIPALGARGFLGENMDFTPTEAGVYEFNCPMRMVNPSYLVVTN